MDIVIICSYKGLGHPKDIFLISSICFLSALSQSITLCLFPFLKFSIIKNSSKIFFFISVM